MVVHLSRPLFPSFAAQTRFATKSRPSVGTTISCFAPNHSMKFKRDYTSVMIVPTGIGAAIGGYAGDALPVARALSSVVDCLISHPNVLNAAMLYWPMPNTLYVEGYALDRFAEGLWGLQPVHQNKVGLVLDAGIEEDIQLRHLQVADAARASLGLPVVEYAVTDTPLEVEMWVDPKSGQSTGRIKHPGSLLRAVQTLINRSKVNAIAVVGRFPEDDLQETDDYRQGMGIDILAGVEAIISHLVVREFHIPCAHAPALSPLPLSLSLSPKSAAEEEPTIKLMPMNIGTVGMSLSSSVIHEFSRCSIFVFNLGYTFLPCVLAGLSNAPQYIENSESLEKGCILASNVDSVILPVDACAGDGALAFARMSRNKPLIIAVEENDTVLNDTPDNLGIEVVKVSNYWEAIGVIAAHKAGVNPHSLRRNRIKNLQRVPLVPANGYAVSSTKHIACNKLKWNG